MITGPLPPASIWGTWSENIEVRDPEDGTLIDLSTVTEATLLLRDSVEKFNELTLTKSNGDITFPSTGIIQWRAEQPAMGTLRSKVYEVILTLEDADDVVPVMLATIAIVE